MKKLLLLAIAVIMTGCTAEDAPQTVNAVSTNGNDISLMWFSGTYQSDLLEDTDPMVRNGHIIEIDLTSDMLTGLHGRHTLDLSQDQYMATQNSLKVYHNGDIFTFYRVNASSNIAVEVTLDGVFNHVGAYIREQ